jgi:circadian clock protein KaiB
VKAVKTSRATKTPRKTLDPPPAARYVLRLYVAGGTSRSRQAIMRIRQFCDTELPGRFHLEIIDVFQQPILARDGQIVATPTLVRELPRPVRRLIGNLSNTANLFVGLEVETKGGDKR